MQKNVGIELLRLLCMLMVVTLHIIGAGGVLTVLVPGTIDYKIMWLWETFCYGAVNCFALITGYLMCDRKIQFRKWINFFFEFFIITFMIYVVTRILHFHNASLATMFVGSIPYVAPLWYVKSYLGLLVFVPFVNAYFKKKHRGTLIILMLMFINFSVVPTITNTDFFGMAKGYSVMWLLVMYYVGGTIKMNEYDKSVNRWLCLVGFAVFTVLAWVSKLIMEDIIMKQSGEFVEWNTMIAYTSPLIILAAICLFLFMLNVSIRLPKLFFRISEASFGIYVVHMHYVINGRYISNKWAWTVELPRTDMYMQLLSGVLGVFIVSLVVSIVCTYIARIIIELISRIPIHRKVTEILNKDLVEEI